MTSDVKPIRVVLLAPLTVVGGITTWTRCLLKYSNPALVTYRTLDTSKMYDPLGKKLGPLGAVLGLRDAFMRLLRLIGAMISFRPNLVFFTCAPSIGLLARDVPYLMLLRLCRVRALVHLRGGDVDRFFGRNACTRFIIRHAMNGAAVVLVITPETEVKARELFGPRKVVYVPNMIDDEKVVTALDKKAQEATDTHPVQLVHVAWQAPAKGSLEIVDAMAMVQSPAACELVGTVGVGNRRLIEDRIAQRNVADKVRLGGARYGADLQRTFLGADVFVFPSHTEGFPNVILEAMAYGLPIVATEVGNIREMIGADSPAPAGLLLGAVPADPADLAATIDRLAADPDLRQRLSENGRARIRRYLATRLVPELETFLRDLCTDDPRTMTMHRWGHCARMDGEQASQNAHGQANHYEP